MEKEPFADQLFISKQALNSQYQRILMQKYIFTLSLFWLFFGSQQLTNAQQAALKDYLASLPEGISISMKAETKSGTLTYEQKANKQIPSASVIKVPILIELMRQVEAKQIRWNEKYILEEADKVGGSGNLQHQVTGKKYSIKALALEMIKESDNTATNILIRRVDMEKVNQLLDELGLAQTKLQRLMMDFKAIEQGRQNYTSAADMNQLMGLLLRQELLSKKWNKKALNILTQCADRSTIPHLLPPKTKVAHKTGTLDYVRGDSGIIFGKRDAVVVSIFVEHFSSFEEAETIIAEIAQLLYQTQL